MSNWRVQLIKWHVFREEIRSHLTRDIMLIEVPILYPINVQAITHNNRAHQPLLQSPNVAAADESQLHNQTRAAIK